MYYLDTNVIIDIIRGKYPMLKYHFSQMSHSDIAIPAVVVAELEFGSQHSGNYEKNSREAMDVIRNFDIAPFGMNEAIAYGKIRNELSSKGISIGPNDLFIAATVLANDGILVTHNVREFSRISVLNVEDWTI